MQSFVEFLREKGRVDSRHLPHYLRRVRMYREFAIRPTSGMVSGIRNNAAAAFGQGRQFTAFLSVLGRSYQDWQVRQARHALRLYWYYSRAGQKRQPPSVHGPKQAALAVSASRDTLEEKLVYLMRLRHLSYRTEKTYLSWVRRFRTFSLCRGVGNLTEDDLKCFLSHLAVERHVSAATQKQAFNALQFLFRNVLEVLFDRDRRKAVAGVSLPQALVRKYPNAGKDWGWFWVFPSAKLSIDPFSGIVRCHHLYPLLCRRRSTKPSYAR